MTEVKAEELADQCSTCPAHFVQHMPCNCTKFPNQFSRKLNKELEAIYKKSTNQIEMLQGLFRTMNFVHSVEEMYTFLFNKYSSTEGEAPVEPQTTAPSTSTLNGNGMAAPLKIIPFGTPLPPARADEHLANLYTNKIQSLHSIWILQANRRRIISDWEMEQLMCVIYNGDFRYPIYQLMSTLFEALCPKDDTEAYNKWNPIGNMLLKELLSLIDKRINEIK